LRGKATQSHSANAALPVSAHLPEGESAESSTSIGRTQPTSKPDTRSERFALWRALAEASVRHGPQPRMAARTRTSQRASPDPEPKRGSGCFLEARTEAEAKVLATKLPFWMLTAEAVSARQGPIEVRGSGSFRRSGTSRDRRLEGCLPPASHRGGTQAQDTQRESDDVSHGARFLSAYEPRRSLCRLASSTPSALGVSHSLSGLSPPGPGGFVSRHIRP
jgi:hypothetical protein